MIMGVGDERPPVGMDGQPDRFAVRGLGHSPFVQIRAAFIEPLHATISFDAGLQFWALDIGKYSGNLTDFGFSGRYQLFDSLSVGVGYKFYRQDIDSADESFFGEYRFEYRGPIVDIRARF